MIKRILMVISFPIILPIQGLELIYFSIRWILTGEEFGDPIFFKIFNK